MPSIVPAYYYAQQGADITKPFPAQSFGGWTKTQLPLDPKKTAVVVMHAWQMPSYEDCPGLYSHVEYIPRAEKMLEKKFPDFVETVRKSGVRLIHVGAGFEPQLQKFAGYRRMVEKYPPQKLPQIPTSKALDVMREYHWNVTAAATRSRDEDIERSFTQRGFAIKPNEDEDVVVASNQLFSWCCDHGIEHLIYAGFAVNACLTISPCGFFDMRRHGLICSVVGDLTTAVENKESCATQSNRAYGLWNFAVNSGFVFLSEDLNKTLLK